MWRKSLVLMLSEQHTSTERWVKPLEVSKALILSLLGQTCETYARKNSIKKISKTVAGIVAAHYLLFAVCSFWCRLNITSRRLNRGTAQCPQSEWWNILTPCSKWDEDEADCLQETDKMWVAEWKHHLQIVPISVLLLSVLTQGRNTEQGFFLRLDVVIYGSEYKCCRTKGS